MGVLRKRSGQFTPLLEHLEVDNEYDMIYMVDGASIPESEFRSLTLMVTSLLR